jgi:ankyrin repeat protein
MNLCIDIHKFDINEAFCISAKYGYLEMVDFLLQKGANIHANNDFALRWSAANGKLSVVTHLLDHGANIHANDDEALRRSANNGHLEVVQYLIEHGAYIHAMSDEAVRYGAWNGHLDIVKYLVNKGADIHAGITPHHRKNDALDRCLSMGYSEIVEYIIGRKDVNKDAINSALLYAIYSRNSSLIKYLIQHGANIESLDNYSRSKLEILISGN